MINRLKDIGPIAWIIGHWQLVLALAGAAVLCLGISYCKGRSDGYDLRIAEEAEDAERARKLNEESRGKAAGERETDTDTINDNQEARDNAIEDAQSNGAPSAASNALNCERLRQANADLSQFPACGGREGGGETAPRP